MVPVLLSPAVGQVGQLPAGYHVEVDMESPSELLYGGHHLLFEGRRELDVVQSWGGGHQLDAALTLRRMVVVQTDGTGCRHAQLVASPVVEPGVGVTVPFHVGPADVAQSVFVVYSQQVRSHHFTRDWSTIVKYGTIHPRFLQKDRICS